MSALTAARRATHSPRFTAPLEAHVTGSDGHMQQEETKENENGYVSNCPWFRSREFSHAAMVRQARNQPARGVRQGRPLLKICGWLQVAQKVLYVSLVGSYCGNGLFERLAYYLCGA